MKTKTITAALILSLMLAVGAHARSAVPLIEPPHIELAVGGDNADTDAVKNAIVAGGAQVQWAVVSSEPGKLRLRYIKNGKHEVIVDALYDATGYQLKYVSSSNMKYDPDSLDGPVIHPYYNKWIEQLMHSIANAYTKTPRP